MLPKKMIDLGSARSAIRELFAYGERRAAEIGRENVFDFSLGNPSIEPPPAVENEIRRLIETESSKALHGYTPAAGAPQVRETIARYISGTFGVPAAAADLYLTCGAAASLCICLTALLDPGEEVITFAPYFPEYKVFVEKAGGRLTTVPVRRDDLQPDTVALEAAVSADTAVVIVNSPNNPTGAVYTEQSLTAVAGGLRRAAARYGHPIYLLADEPYRELVYDDIPVAYIPQLYADTIVCYSYSKSLSLPGDRIGYIFVPPAVTRSADVMAAVQGAGRALGYVCAPSFFQRVIAACQGKTSDIEVYCRNRDRLYGALTDMGFSAVHPDGAFYLFVRSPEPDAVAFSERAKAHELLLVPSDSFGLPGYVRIAYCVDGAMIERSLPAFAALAAEYGLRQSNEGAKA